MEIEVFRQWKGENSTLSTISVNGVRLGYVLEDVDRELKQDMLLSDILKTKIHGRTAIPEGRYQVIITYSNRFKKLLPILINVPGFAGIRIHPGNTHQDTDGCLLPGTTKNKVGNEYQVFNSRVLHNEILLKIQKALEEQEKVWINIISKY